MLDFLVTFGVMSLVMSIVIILLLTLQKSIKKRFTPLSRYIIWAVIIIRLCIPVGLGILPELFTVSVTEQPEPVIMTEDYQDRVLAELVVEGKTDYVSPSVESYIEEHPEILKETNIFELTKEDMLTGVLILLLSGAAVFITVTLIRYFISIARLGRGLNKPTFELEGIYASVCDEMSLKRKPKLYISRNATSPMLYGFIRTKVLLPDMDMDEENLRHIICHELTHYKRGDLYLKLAAMLANALQWFNPFVYIACRRMSEEAELSCDAAVLGQTDMEGRVDYGNSMLEIVKRCKAAPELTTGFNPKKKAVKERFENIIDTTKRKKAVAILIAVLIVALVCTSIIGCTTKHKSGVVQGTDDITVEYEDTADTTEEEIDMNEVERQRIEQGIFHVKVDQWHTESEDWKLYYDFDTETLVLEHSDGRRFAYGEEAEGVHTLTPAYKHGENTGAYSWLIGDYIVINYTVPKNKNEDLAPTYLAIVDVNDGSVKAVHTDTVDEILALHGLDRDFLIPFKDWYGTGMLDYSYSFYPMGNEDSTEISLYTTLTFNGLSYSLDCVTGFDKTTDKLGQTVATKLYYDDPDPLEEWEKKYAVKHDDVTKIENVRGTEGIKLFEAFLKNDTDYLEKKAGYTKGTLEDYKTLRFGSYMFAADKYASGVVNPLLLYVEITESGIEGLEPGMHRFVYNNRDHGEYISHYCAHYAGPALNEPATMWIGLSDEPMLPDPHSYTESDFWAMMMMLRYNYSANTVDEFEERAESVFGVSVDLDDYTVDKLYGEMEKWEYKDDKIYEYSVIEYAESYVTVQFYADYGMTIPAYKIRYNFHYIEITDDGRRFDKQVFDAPSEKFDITDKEAIYS